MVHTQENSATHVASVLCAWPSGDRSVKHARERRDGHKYLIVRGCEYRHQGGTVMVSLKTPTEITTVVRIRTKNSRSSLRSTTTQGAHRHPGCRASAFSTGDGKPWCSSTEEANRYVVAFGLPALVARSSKPETGRAHITSQLRNAVERAPFYPGTRILLTTTRRPQAIGAQFQFEFGTDAHSCRGPPPDSADSEYFPDEQGASSSAAVISSFDDYAARSVTVLLGAPTTRHMISIS